MFSMRLEKIARLLSAQLVGKDATVTGISIDTRTIKGGELFVAIKGPNFDGHDFILDALNKGAVACLVETNTDVSKLGDNKSFVKTENTHAALGLLSRLWRQEFNIPLIAITGSNGKTTVKEMLASILQQQHRVLATEGNLNNDFGVPLTLFRLHKEIDAAVIEMGANHLGEIKYLVNLALPDVAIITNAGSAHIEGFGSLENIAKAKGEIYEGLAKEGFAIINADDHFSDYWKKIVKGKKVMTFGINNKADVMTEWTAKANGSELKLTTPEGNCKINLKLLGVHNIMNVLAAVTAAIAVHIPLQQIVKGIESLKPVNGRLQIKPGLNDSCLIDDTYNANPTSLMAAINVLREFKGKRYLALGDMGELGNNSIKLHKEAGLYAKEKGVDSLFSYGELAASAATEFGNNGFSYEKQEEMIDALRSELTKDVTLLVKGSRSMHMENVVNALAGVEI